jgi:hypothetical protein
VTEIDERDPDAESGEEGAAQPRTPEPEPESAKEASLRADAEKTEPRHHSARRVAVHGGAVSGLGGLATLAHAAGPGAALAATATAGIVAAGAAVYRKRGTGRGGTALRRRSAGSARGSKRTATRTVTRRSGTAGAGAGASRGRRTGAMRRAHGGATGTLSKRVPRSAGVASGTRSGRRAATSGTRGAGTGSRAGRFVRRPLGRSGSTARGASAGSRHGRAHGGLGAPTASTRRTRSTARRAADRQPRTPTTTARGAARAKTTKARPTTHTDPPHTPRKGRGAPAGKAKPTTGTKPPKKTTAPAPKHKKNSRKPDRKTPGKSAKTTPPTPATPAGPAAETAKTTTAPTAPAPKPGRRVTAPGVTPKGSSMATESTIDAVIDAAAEHIGGFQPENALQILHWLQGLQRLYQEIGVHLTQTAARLADEEPIERLVTDHLHSVGGQTATLGDWFGETEHIFEAAHAVELQRLRDPRVNERHWDVDANS